MNRIIAVVIGIIVNVLYVKAAVEPFNGLVVDGQGSPVKGVKIWVVNESNHSTTDKQGRFGFSSVEENDTLKMKVKKEVYKIPIEGRKSIKITLVDTKPKEYKEEPELADLGYGYIKRRERVSASNGITGAQLRATGASDLLRALSGLVPGLNVAQGPKGANTSGTNIRGQSSLLSPTTPLFIVDGVIVDSFDGVNLYSVDRVEVIKEGSIYGSRGANGVISVTTIK
ncbi:MAG: TonB-dependent receptor plug domain-containing protein [Muribaculum sp.]|nr:TonB-dependent receptor plug domain-containing protein [Muribaculum sp.]